MSATETTVALAQLTLALAGALLLGWEAWLLRRGGDRAAPAFHRRAPILLGLLGALGLFAYSNFGWANRGRLLHVWDTYHYYLGAKYFPELQYLHLYECTAVAEAEAGDRGAVALRTMRDLRTNLEIETLDILIDGTPCTSRFSAERWASFQRDVMWFRAQADDDQWRRIQRDHGYNATPTWTATGHWLTNLAPASDVSITFLLLLDPLLLLAMLAILGKSFGWRACAIAALVLGTYVPSRFYWAGGAFLRHDWLFCMVAGVCALRRDRPLLGGGLLAYAALLRLFPAALFAGPLLAALDHVRRTRRLPVQHVRFFAGALVVTALALPPSLAATGDWGAGFVANTVKHAGTPFTNHMGLPTVLSYRPDETVRELRQESTKKLWPRFRAARNHALAELRPVLLVAGLALLALLLWAARKAQLWHSAAASLVLVPALLQLTCYYYCFVVLLAVFAARRDGPGSAAGACLLAMCAASIALPLGLPQLLGTTLGTDELFVAQSALALLGFGAVLACSLTADRGRPRSGSGVEASPRR
jgi:hypothetical protein